MESLSYVFVFAFGAIIGSFLNVVIYRMHTGRSLGGRSHCMTCGTHLEWHDLFPVISYLVLCAKCRVCEAHIPPRYIIVELMTALSFVFLWHLFAWQWLLFGLYALLLAALIVIIVYDIRHTIIPDELTLFIGFVAFVFLFRSYRMGESGDHIMLAVISALATATFFAGLWYVSKGRWIGLGDAKLAFPLALIVGFTGAFSMVVLSFWVGAGLSVLLLALQRLLERWKTRLPYLQRTITMKSEVPFAPFLIAGFVLVHFFHADIFVITSYLIPF